MSNLAYFYPQDNVAGTAILSIGAGTEDSAYPRANLYDLNPAKPMKFTTTTGAVVFDWTTPQRVDAVLLPHHNLQAGLEVRWQMHTANVWTTPDVNQAFTIPAWDEDGFPPSVWLDLATLVPIAANRTKRYGRFVVVGVNGSAVAIGELPIYNLKRELSPRNITYPVRVREIRPRREQETDYLVKTVYDLGTKVREIETQTKTSITAGVAQLLAWFRACKGPALMTAIVPDQSKNLGLLVRWVNDFEHEESFLDVAGVPLLWREVSRGLPL